MILRRARLACRGPSLAWHAPQSAHRGEEESRRLPPIRAATIIVRGGYDRLDDGRAALDRWVTASGLRPAGPVRIVYLQYGAAPDLRIPRGYVVAAAAEYVTELQLPVE